MSRIHKLENIYEEQLKKHKVNNVSNFIHSILDADITKGKYARFLIDCFLNDKFLEEDLEGKLDSTVGQAIGLFHKHKSKLPEDMRSVFKYSSPGDLWNSVKQFQGELSGKELKREEQEKIYRETKFIYKDEVTGFQIVSPLTKESAQWWGKGTRWCTSAEKNNMFKYYAKRAPLFILLVPSSENTTGSKLQLWKNEYNIQFMDEDDNRIKLEYIEQNWSFLEPICIWLNNIRYIPKEYRTKEMSIISINKYKCHLFFVPEEFRTQELCELAIKNNGKSLSVVPNEYKTKEFCELAIQQNGYALEDVPKELITPELCELAVKQNGLALNYVPEKLKTKELCELAVQQNGLILRYVPDHLKILRICELAVKQNGLALEDVPNNLITSELCEIAVRQDGRSLQYVSEDFKTKELCEIAVQKDGWALEYIPKKIKTPEFYRIAVQQNIKNIQNVPDKYKTKELCKMAVKQNGLALIYIPEELKTPELCEMAVQKYGSLLEYVPEKLKTKELCELAVRKSGWALEYVPEKHFTLKMGEQAIRMNNKHFNQQFIYNKLKTPELCKIAVQQYGIFLKYVPEELKTLEICKLAVRNNSMALEYVPKIFFPKNTMKTKILNLFLRRMKCFMEIYLYNAVKQNGSSLQYIPEYLKTKEICELAVSQSISNILYCSKNYRIKNQDIMIKALYDKLLSSATMSDYICYKENINNLKEISHPSQKKYSDLIDFIKQHQKNEPDNTQYPTNKKIDNFQQYDEIKNILRRKKQ